MQFILDGWMDNFPEKEKEKEKRGVNIQKEQGKFEL